MKKIFNLLVILFVAIFTWTSCSKDDGDWDPMKWEKYSYQTEKMSNGEKAISVPKSGGTYTFKCKNYNHLWIENVWEEVGRQREIFRYMYNDSPIINGNFTATQIQDGSTFTITFAPNKTEKERIAHVDVSAGDTGDHFTFKQSEQ